jgi:hypothetical protein
MDLSGYSVYSTTKTDRYDIAEILLKMALSTINKIKSSRNFDRIPWYHKTIPQPLDEVFTIIVKGSKKMKIQKPYIQLHTIPWP